MTSEVNRSGNPSCDSCAVYRWVEENQHAYLNWVVTKLSPSPEKVDSSVHALKVRQPESDSLLERVCNFAMNLFKTLLTIVFVPYAMVAVDWCVRGYQKLFNKEEGGISIKQTKIQIKETQVKIKEQEINDGKEEQE